MSSAAPKDPPTRASLIASRVLQRLAYYPFLIASLLVFPEGIPWMAAAWLGLAALRLRRGLSIWPPLATCLAILLIKRTDWGPGMMTLLAGLAAAAAIDGRSRRKPSWVKARLIGFSAVLAAWLFLAIQWPVSARTSRTPALAPDRPVVLLGDSLMSGGVARVLQSRIMVPVVDLSQGGITTADGVKWIPELQKARPQAVVIELGGHDSLRGRARSEAKANLEKIIAAAKESGAAVFLFEIPLGFISDPYGGLQRGLAREHDLELISDGAIRQLVYFSPFTPLGRWTGRLLSYDGLHPNEAGNAFLAGRIEAALVRVYGPSLQR